MVATVEQLQERLAVLKSPAQLEALQRKAKTVTQDLDALLDKKKQANEAPTNANEAKVIQNADITLSTLILQHIQIVELFELMHKWDSVAQQLPAIVSRLQALRSLHEASAALHDTVQQLDTQQEALKKVLKSNSELLAQVAGSCIVCALSSLLTGRHELPHQHDRHSIQCDSFGTTFCRSSKTYQVNLRKIKQL